MSERKKLKQGVLILFVLFLMLLLLPDKFSFEVIEAYIPGSLWNQTTKLSLSQDYEFFNGRKTYASSVTGAYYTARLSLAEYLEENKKQATALFM